jgi:hypothetical protein
VPVSARSASASNRVAMLSGMGVGMIQAATPLVFWWLDSAIVYALGLAVVAAIYIGFAVGDGRVKVIAVESSVAFTFVIVSAAAITATPWLLVVGLWAMGARTCGSTAPSSWPTRVGGRRSAWPSTGWWPRSSWSRSPPACTSASAF